MNGKTTITHTKPPQFLERLNFMTGQNSDRVFDRYTKASTQTTQLLQAIKMDTHFTRNAYDTKAGHQ